MGILITSVKSYYTLDVWVLAQILQLYNQKFSMQFLNEKIDPCHRLLDQMLMAARSGTANIVEGKSRHQTSIETELRLLDVARGSIAELQQDYFTLALDHYIEPWSKHSEAHKAFRAIPLDAPAYTDDWMREAYLHVQRQREKFRTWFEHPELAVRINCFLIMTERILLMLEKLMGSLLEEFRQKGGFTEGMSQERVAARQQQAAATGAPACPGCGKPMVLRYRKKGAVNNQFWGCLDYPKCQGTRPIGQ
ncbi:MAG: four helix bundle protein [Bacteroidales bacterium]|nr:four helix bundle protein [Bacteroidales bacterium]